MSTNVAIKEFKPFKSALFLFFLQLIIPFIIGILFMVFKLDELVPESLLSGVGPALWLGVCLYYGQRTEKKYPDVLNKANIRKVALWFTLFSGIILAGLVGLMVLFGQFEISAEDIAAGLISLTFLIIFNIFLYFGTRYFIGQGVKQYKKRKLYIENKAKKLAK